MNYERLYDIDISETVLPNKETFFDAHSFIQRFVHMCTLQCTVQYSAADIRTESDA